MKSFLMFCFVSFGFFFGAASVASAQPVIRQQSSCTTSFPGSSCQQQACQIVRDIRGLQLTCNDPSDQAAVDAAIAGLTARYDRLASVCHGEATQIAQNYINWIQSPEFREQFCAGRETTGGPGGVTVRAAPRRVTRPGRERGPERQPGPTRRDERRVICIERHHARRGPNNTCVCDVAAGTVRAPLYYQVPGDPDNTYGSCPIIDFAAAQTVVADTSGISRQLAELRAAQEALCRPTDGQPLPAACGELRDLIDQLARGQLDLRTDLDGLTGRVGELERQMREVRHTVYDDHEPRIRALEARNPARLRLDVDTRLRVIIPGIRESHASLAGGAGAILRYQFSRHGEFFVRGLAGGATSGHGIGETFYVEGGAGFTWHPVHNGRLALSIGLFGYDLIDPGDQGDGGIDGDMRRWGVGGDLTLNIRLTDLTSPVELRLLVGLGVSYDEAYWWTATDGLMGTHGTAVLPSFGFRIHF